MMPCQLSKPMDGNTRVDKETSSIIVGLI